MPRIAPVWNGAVIASVISSFSVLLRLSFFIFTEYIWLDDREQTSLSSPIGAIVIATILIFSLLNSWPGALIVN